MVGSFSRFQFASSSISSSRETAPLRITTDNWDEGEIFDWYQEQQHTTIRTLELRKERDTVKHEFVVVYVDDKTIYRVDRRALGGPNPDAVIWGCEAEDVICPVNSDELNRIHSDTDAEIVLEFNNRKPDLYVIIAVCIAMRMNPRSKKYTLQHFNCYFLARTIMAIVTRHCLLQHNDVLTAQSELLRWDIASAPNLSKEEVVGKDWSMLDAAARMATTTALERSMYPIVASHTVTHVKDGEEIKETRVRDGEEIKEIVSAVIQDAITRIIKHWVGNELLYALYKEVLAAAELTLWYETREHNLSTAKHRGEFEAAVGRIMGILVSEHRERKGILDEMTSKLEEKLLTETQTPPDVDLQPEPMQGAPITMHDQQSGVNLVRATTDQLRRRAGRAISSSITQAVRFGCHEPHANGPGMLLHKAAKLVTRVPVGIWRKLPADLAQVILTELREHVDFLWEEIDQALTSWKLKDEIAQNIVDNILRNSEGAVPDSIVRIFVKGEKNHILRMTRNHSKMVAHFVLVGEDDVYSGLRQNMEEIWRNVLPHSAPQSRFKEAKEVITRFATAVKDDINTVVQHELPYRVYQRKARVHSSGGG